MNLQMFSVSALNAGSGFNLSISFPPKRAEFAASVSSRCFLSQVPRKAKCIVASSGDAIDSASNPDDPKVKSKKPRSRRTKGVEKKNEDSEKPFPEMIPKKLRRGRKSEAAAVEDFVRDSLQRTFNSIRQQNPEILEGMEKIIKDKADRGNTFSSFDDESSDDEIDDDESETGEKTMVVEEEDSSWPLDADVGWGIRASEYFEQHSIKNVVGEDGTEIDWEGEIDNGLVKEINCLEWESFAFHPSPLIVLVFERYNRSSLNWKVLRELEKAAEVYWQAKDRLPPRTIKIDVNIERDLAYALKAKECPQILFLRGNKILYREKEFRTAEELVQMIAHFYYNAKKPSFVDDSALLSTGPWR